MSKRCLNLKGKALESELERSGLDEQSYYAAFDRWISENPSQENTDHLPSDQWFNEYKGTREVPVNIPEVRQVYRNMADRNMTEWTAGEKFTSDEGVDMPVDDSFLDSQKEAFQKVFGNEGVYDYTDNKGTRHVGVYHITGRTDNGRNALTEKIADPVERKLAGMGSFNGKIEHLKKTLKKNGFGASSAVYSILIPVLSSEEGRKAFRNMPYSEIWKTMITGGRQDLAHIYNQAFNIAADEALEKYLTDYLAKYNVEVKIDEDTIRQFGSMNGMVDVLNKVIYLSRERNLITLPEEFAHEFFELMGTVRNRKTGNPLYMELFDLVKDTETYRQVYDRYRDIYKVDGKPDDEKIRKEALGQALASAIVARWDENARPENEKTFWDRLKEFVEKILETFRKIKPVSFEDTMDMLAKDILEGSTKYLDTYLDKTGGAYSLLDYSRTLAEQTAKDSGKAVHYMQEFSGMGNIMTGSIAYRRQGTVYRQGLDSLHDIDMEVPSDVHGIDLHSTELGNLRFEARRNFGSTGLLEYFRRQPYFKKVLEKFPDLELLAAYPPKGSYDITINSVMSEDRSLVERFASLTGSYASRLENFTGEERGKIYLFDFFIMDRTSQDFVTQWDEENRINLMAWQTPMAMKLSNMGRPKDVFDYQHWKTVSGVHAINPDYLMYQINPNNRSFTFKDGTRIDNLPFTPNEEQAKALNVIDEFLQNPEKGRTLTLAGYAGTGKTSIMQIIAAKYSNMFYPLYFAATTNEAAHVLEGKISSLGYKARTINKIFGIVPEPGAGQEYDLKKLETVFKGAKIQPGSTVVIDESSMIPEKNYNAIMEIAGAYDVRIIFVGDDAQLPPVGETKKAVPFREKDNIIRLTKVERTGDNAILNEATRIRGHESLTYESSFNDKGEGVAYVSQDTEKGRELIKTIIDTYIKGIKDNRNYFKIIAATNDAVKRYNDYVRTKLGYTGVIPHVGEPVVGYDNWGYDSLTREYKFINSGYYTVSKVGSVRTSDISGTVQNALKYLSSEAKARLGIQDNEPFTLTVIPVVLTGDNGDVSVDFCDVTVNRKNYSTVEKIGRIKSELWKTVGKLDRNRKTAVLGLINALDDALFVNGAVTYEGRTVQNKRYDFGYAMTVHKSQGSTFENILVDDDSIEKFPTAGKRTGISIDGRPSSQATGMDSEEVDTHEALRYVAVTRASKTATIVSSHTKAQGSPLDHVQENPAEIKPETSASTEQKPKQSGQLDRIKPEDWIYGRIDNTDRYDGDTYKAVRPAGGDIGGAVEAEYSEGVWYIKDNTTSEIADSTRKDLFARISDMLKVGDRISFNGREYTQHRISTAKLHVETTAGDNTYATRTKANAAYGDFTVALGENLNTAGERLTRSAAGAKYVGAQLPVMSEKGGILNEDDIKSIGDNILEQIRTVNGGGIPSAPVILNIAGNAIDVLSMEQGTYDKAVLDIIKYLIRKGLKIKEIRTGGQTGIDEAGTKAAQELDLGWSILTTGNYKIRGKDGKDKGVKDRWWEDPEALDYFMDRFNRKITLQKVEVEHDEKEEQALDELPFKVRELNPSGQYRHVVTLTGNRDANPDYEETKDTINVLINKGIIPVGSKIALSEGNIGRLSDILRIFRSMGDAGIYPTGTYTMLSFKDITAGQKKGLERLGVMFNDSDNTMLVPEYSVGYTESELTLMQQERNLRSSGLFRDSELRRLAVAAIYKLSDVITRLNTEPDAADELLVDWNAVYDDNTQDRYAALREADYTSMTRAEVIDYIGLDRLMDIVIKEGIFGMGNTDVENDTTLDKMELIYGNFDAFIRMGYDALASLEQIGMTERNKDVDLSNTEAIQNTAVDEEDVQSVTEIFGSSAEHWQIGFRQVSAVRSLSQLMKRTLGSLLDLDLEGKAKKDEFLQPQRVDATKAAVKILALTQGAGNIEDMITQLKAHVSEFPWLAQLVGTYHVDGDLSQPEKQGILLDKENDQFRSQFYSNFKKYFQSYTVLYTTKGGKRRARNLNTPDFVDTSIKKFSTEALQANLGMFRFWDAGHSTVTKEFWNLVDNILGTRSIGPVSDADVKENSLREILTRDDVTPETETLTYKNGIILKRLKEAYEALGFESPDEGQLGALFPRVKDIYVKGRTDGIINAFDFIARKFYDSIYFDIDDTEDGKPENIFYAGDFIKKVRSDLKTILSPLALVLGNTQETVAYEGGKLHYGYVLPSYMNELIRKLKGNVKDYSTFLQDNYGAYTGWFKAPVQGEFAGLENGRGFSSYGGWMNIILAILDGKSSIISAEDMKRNLDHTVVLTDNGVAYMDKTDARYIASRLSMYLYDANGRWAWHGIPTESNKPSEEYIKLPKFKRDDVLRYLVNMVFPQEVNRIRTGLARREAFRKDYLTEDNRIANFDDSSVSKSNGNSTKFMFLSFLQKYIDGTPLDNEEDRKFSAALRKYINHQDMDNTSFDGTLERETYNIDTQRWESSAQNYTSELLWFKDRLEDVIRRSMEDEFETTVLDWQRKGFLVVDGQLTRDRYGNVEGKIKEMYDGMLSSVNMQDLKDFVYADFFASINILQLSVGDLAYYKNSDDAQKRFGELHSPGARPNVLATDPSDRNKLLSDGFARTMYIKDSINPSEILENLKQVYRNIENSRRFRTAGEKERYRKHVADLMAAFESVNWADAQGYSSPTSYRKKMGLFGKWSYEQEEAYRRLKEGTFSIDDLSILWQPIKPFVYTQIGKTNNASDGMFMPFLKMGVQNKNSEYLLLMADALIRGEGYHSQLQAIYDFMEESAERNPARGIDTIQFESAVKTGLMGAVDLNGLDYEQTLQALRNAAYDIEGQDGYNQNSIHTLPFEDYMIQLEIPEHLTDGSAAQGSQDRTIIIADMPETDADGNPYTIDFEDTDGNVRKFPVGEVKKRYLAAIQDNVNRAVEALKRRLGVNLINPKLSNIALSRMLRDGILKDGRFGSDMLWACSTDENGNFNVPLDDPIQAERIQQLLTSMIRKTVYRHNIAGGPAVQVSSWGALNGTQLHVRFKGKNGKVVMSSAEFMAKKATGDSSVEKYASYSDYISQNQYSLAYCEAYVSPYMVSLFEDFIARDDEGNEYIDIEAIRKNNPKLLDMVGYRMPTESKYSMLPIKIAGFLPHASGETIMLPAELTVFTGSDFDVDKMYLMRYAFTKDKDGAYMLSDRRVDRNNNMIVATHLSVLTSPLVADQILTAQSFDNLKEIAYRTAVAEQEGMTYKSLADKSLDQLKDMMFKGNNICFIRTQVNYHRQNMVAGHLIGVFAKTGISHKIINMHNGGNGAVLNLIETDRNGNTRPFIHAFTIKDRYRTFTMNGAVRLDPSYMSDGITRVSDALQQFQAASVDAVKDPVLNYINVNLATVNVMTTLIRFGYDTEAAALFLASPIIRELTRRYEQETADKGYASMDDVIDTIQDELEGGNEGSLAQSFEEDFPFDPEYFMEQYKPDGQRKPEDDYRMLELMRRIGSVSNILRDISNMTKYDSITSGVGPGVSDIVVSELQTDGFDSDSYIKNSSEIREAAVHPLVSIFYSAQFGTSGLVENLIYGGKFILPALERMTIRQASDMFGYMGRNLAKKIQDFVLSYYICPFDMSAEHRRKVVIDFPASIYPELAERYGDNMFIRAIQRNFEAVDPEKPDTGFWNLTLSTRGLDNTDVENLKAAWTQLLEDEQRRIAELPDTASENERQNLALQLFEYNYMKGGLSFSPKTFIRLAPSQVRLAVPGYYENLVRFPVLSDIDYRNLLYQFMLNRGIANAGTFTAADFTGGTVIAESDRSGFTGKLKEAPRMTEGIVRLQNKKGTVRWAYMTVDKDNVAKFSYRDKLGGDDNDVFEIDPSVDITENNISSIAGLLGTSPREQAGMQSEERIDPSEVPSKDPKTGGGAAMLKNIQEQQSAFDTLMQIAGEKGDIAQTGDVAADFETVLEYMSRPSISPRGKELSSTYAAYGATISVDSKKVMRNWLEQLKAIRGNEELLEGKTMEQFLSEIKKDLDDKNICGR